MIVETYHRLEQYVSSWRSGLLNRYNPFFYGTLQLIGITHLVLSPFAVSVSFGRCASVAGPAALFCGKIGACIRATARS